jgi:hypothetical protein
MGDEFGAQDFCFCCSSLGTQAVMTFRDLLSELSSV